MYNQYRGVFISSGALLFIYLLYFSGTLPHLATFGDYTTSLLPGSSDSSSKPADIPQSSTIDLPSSGEVEEYEDYEDGSTINIPGTVEPFYGLPELCAETEWTEGLWLHCHSYCGENKTSVCGGLNNARNRIQTCLRLAIDLGAGIILPSATTRNEDHLLDTDQKTVCPEYFWNTEYLNIEMAKRCPQMLIRKCDDRSGIENEVLTDQRGYLSAAHHNGTFREMVYKAFNNSDIQFSDINPGNQVVVNYGDSYIGWNYKEAGELSTIRKALFKILKFNESLLQMSRQILQSPELDMGNYIGVHLRGETDWPASFGSSDDQMRLYVDEIQKLQEWAPLKTVYVSCGDEGAIQRFREKLEPSGFKVYDKYTLLASKPEILQMVEALPFDQKAIVEYETLVQSRFWMGVIMSSMSSLIAYAREVEHEGEFFSDFVFPGSSKNGLDRSYTTAPAMKGNNETMLMVVNGVDIMDSFP